MKIAYLDCSSGISGDMLLGALVDAGVPLAFLRRELRKLPLEGYSLSSRTVFRAGLRAVKVDVTVRNPGSEAGRRWKDVRRIIKSSGLDSRVRQAGLAIFAALFEAEAEAHGTTPEKTHLHELGAVDCMVDVLGSLAGLSFLGVEKLVCSAVNLGSGTVRTCHGILPVPTPATARLLKGLPVYSSGVQSELATPTGAAIVSQQTSSFGPLPSMRVERTGTGAGSADFSGHPNVLRIMVGQAAAAEEHQPVTLIETNIDDMSPQVFGYVMERLFEAGALDVFFTPIVMKKARPATMLSVLCRKDDRAKMADILFRETTTIGLRMYETQKMTMERSIRKVKVSGADVRVKISRRGDVTKSKPEYDDCCRVAKKSKRPLRDVIEEAERKSRSLKK